MNNYKSSMIVAASAIAFVLIVCHLVRSYRARKGHERACNDILTSITKGKVP